MTVGVEQDDARLPRFQQLQYAFTRHIRDPEHEPAPEAVGDQAMAVYRRLVYNNVESYMAQAYPVLRSFYPVAQWHALVRDFFVRHKCRSAQFYRAAEEFLAFLRDERGAHPDDPPFMLELAHYEWLELMLYIVDVAVDLDSVDRHGDLLARVPVLSPLVHNVTYRYPVHELDANDPPTEPPETPTHLVVYRDLADATRFVSVNLVTARLLERLAELPGLTGYTHLQAIATEMAHPDPEAVITGGAQTLADLRTRDIVLGVR